MSSTQQFRASYLALLATLWEELERVIEVLEELESHARDYRVAIRIEGFRLQLAVLHDRSRAFPLRAALSDSQHAKLLRLIRDVDALLSRGAGEAPFAISLTSLAAAQNRLFDEARSVSLEEDAAVDVIMAIPPGAARCADQP